ncbi:MAG: serine/threonine-protein kinase PknK, partial [Deltaproteobacteria bacterium]|nr:serine/threonine-protein kinase PknK [Deltaproteobacteria bacterium]
MINIPGYEIVGKIYESHISEVYRAVRNEGKDPVVLKLLAKKYPWPQEIAEYKNEYRMARALQGLSGVIQVYELEKYQNGLLLITEDIQGESLRLLMESGVFSLEESLVMAIQICAGLGEIHAAHVIHKDVNPSNIIMSPHSGILKIIDFGISTDLAHEDTTLVNPTILAGTLAYMSPEQTGRMNCHIDYRTDYYSLGVTLYELFTRKIPFEASDPLELVHSHIAVTPKSPNEINPKLPKAVSNLILKLLAKNAESRYQSASGIKSDLETCLRQIRAHGTVKTFKLACSDVPERFEIPQKLYGRDTDTENLLAAFARVAGGGKEITLVTGEAGIGKTALVQEVYRPVTGRRGYFVSGKFDQFGGNIPHSAVIAACRKLLSQILTESQESLADWKSRLLAALGNTGQVITEVIPEIELIVGPQPMVTELGHIEAQARFRIVFQEFMRALCYGEHPIVIFLDDIQWADTSSIKLLELLMTDSDIRYLFLIAAYRDEEVDSSHPLLTTLEAFRKAHILINSIRLGPLRLEHVSELVADTLHCHRDASEALAELVHQKTSGNPFFLKEFLQTLYQEELVEFDFHLGAWRWDLERIQHHQIPDNAVDLMVRKIRRIPSPNQDLLKMAACIGTEFGIHLLSWAADELPRNVVIALKPSVFEGLIYPIGEGYKFVELEIPVHDREMKIDYRFAHDRIQFAAYSLVPEQERPAIHQHIGQVLLRKTSADPLGNTIFEVVNQMNLATRLITRDVERHELAEMNLEAGKRARASGAYEAAFTYFQTGLKVLGDNSWQRDYYLTLALCVDATEAAYVTTRFDDVKRLTSIVTKHARQLEEKVPVYEMQIRALIALNDRAAAIQIALPLLAELGEKFPDNPNKVQVFADFAKTRLTLSGRRIEAIEDLPEMRDQKKLGAMRIMETVVSAAYSVVPNLFLLMLFRMVRLSVRHGSTRQSAFVYAGYGIILCSIIGDIKSGRRFGELALKLIKRPDLKSQHTRVNFAVHALIFLWCQPLKDGLKCLEDGFQIGLELGDVEYAALSVAFFCTHSFGAGVDLAELGQKMARYTDALGKLRQKFPGYLIQIYHQELLNMMGHSENPCRLVGRAYDEERILPELLESNERAIALATFVQKLRLCYLFHNYHDA